MPPWMRKFFPLCMDSLYLHRFEMLLLPDLLLNLVQESFISKDNFKLYNKVTNIVLIIYSQQKIYLINSRP